MGERDEVLPVLPVTSEGRRRLQVAHLADPPHFPALRRDDRDAGELVVEDLLLLQGLGRGEGAEKPAVP
ncbi:MAG: hypothetical protein OXT72_15295 [Gammaproteobacteria bacterium]|nr:hypothetical protein [Gammaproteobacteria bacterium]MDE0248339.1 hypothetical protein [Gammaproteobacteria bacterium]